jgi:hypothetical protein
MSTTHFKKRKTAFAVLIEHCRETYPHFESSRGQTNIMNALDEHERVKDAVSAARAYLDNQTHANRIALRDALKKL